MTDELAKMNENDQWIVYYTGRNSMGRAVSTHPTEEAATAALHRLQDEHRKYRGATSVRRIDVKGRICD